MRAILHHETARPPLLRRMRCPVAARRACGASNEPARNSARLRCDGQAGASSGGICRDCKTLSAVTTETDGPLMRPVVPHAPQQLDARIGATCRAVPERRTRCGQRWGGHVAKELGDGSSFTSVARRARETPSVRSGGPRDLDAMEQHARLTRTTATRWRPDRHATGPVVLADGGRVFGETATSRRA